MFSEHHQVINLFTRGALSTFQVSKHTLKECLDTPEEDIVDIAIEHWNPQEHHEELLSNTPPIQLDHNVNYTIESHIENNYIDAFCDFDMVPEELIFQTPYVHEEDEFYDTEEIQGQQIDKESNVISNTLHSGETIRNRESQKKTSRFSKVMTVMMSFASLGTSSATQTTESTSFENTFVNNDNLSQEMHFFGTKDPYLP